MRSEGREERVEKEDFGRVEILSECKVFVAHFEPMFVAKATNGEVSDMSLQ